MTTPTSLIFRFLHVAMGFALGLANEAAAAPRITIPSPAGPASVAVAGLTVQGTASGSVAITGLKVNNVAAGSSNGFAAWTATVPLGFGTNAITATATDADGAATTTAPVIVTTTAAPAYIHPEHYPFRRKRGIRIHLQ